MFKPKDLLSTMEFHDMCKILINGYTNTLRMRRFEEEVAKLYSQGMIGGFCHLYIGQEAIAAGCEEALSKEDSIITSYRCHAQAILKSGMSPVMSELLGRGNGISLGKGGSMHMFDPKAKFFGGHGIVGAQIPLGTGIAFASKYRGEKKICVAMLGDGALNQGQVYESFNMAKIWSLPVVYLVENNVYAMGTSTKRSAANSDNLFQRGMGFGIEGVAIDGMNFVEVFNTMSQAKKYALTNGPIIIEMRTYRYKGHSMSDPAKYRTRDEVDHFKERDPILLLENLIIENKILTLSQIQKISESVDSEVENSKNHALSSPEPDLSTLTKNVYC